MSNHGPSPRCEVDENFPPCRQSPPVASSCVGGFSTSRYVGGSAVSPLRGRSSSQRTRSRTRARRRRRSCGGGWRPWSRRRPERCRCHAARAASAP